MRAKFSWANCLCYVLYLAAASSCLAQASFPLANLSGDEERLERALAQRGTLDVVETPLREVLDKLSTQFQVPIVLKLRKLEEAGVHIDTPVTKQLHSMPLESILDLLLDDLELDFMIRDHVILVSTPEHLESPDMMDTRIYPVRDLVAYSVPGTNDDPHRYAADYDSLIDLITTTIAAESWVDVGGPGSIKEFDNSGVLVISQTRRTHREIAQLLATLRKAKEFQGIATLPVSDLKPRRTVSSRIAGRPPADSPRRVGAVSPQTWQVPQVYAE
jgi:hypothetical protein